MIVPIASVAGLSFLVTIISFAVGGLGLVPVGSVVFVVALLLTLIRWVEQRTTEYSCTDRRIVIKSGLLTTRVREMPLAKVEALVIEQSLFGKMLGYGTLVFKGSGGTRRTCSCIEEPLRFYHRVQEQVALAQGRA